ncbi:DNA-directed DNA polymerase eta [Aspergillus melleus]|uniref:DNA-directed DNA polymerase eta n=1 Tax=Aspergillus melleus TaxID=138277 RepID=UPI001E8E68ED|nr:DNA-directed DNA polymerase eta rad30 [Aspergillus melleus]KAH8423520.1 DNA-directed DNA polymerase eta rad30 [Aspergillus melleus]
MTMALNPLRSGILGGSRTRDLRLRPEATRRQKSQRINTYISKGHYLRIPWPAAEIRHDDRIIRIDMSHSSPEPFVASPSSPNNSLKQHSRYTYRQLQLLRQGSTASPLRVIAHIDLDAFYAQCEMVRLQTPRETPLAVRQWDSLIAINYPARSFGITRMISAKEATKLCPDIVLQHVATFREGEGGKWAYRDDAFRKISTDKVCLDPYRAESRKILKVMKDELTRWYEGLVDAETGLGPQAQIQQAALEKASVDEVFVDLSPLVYGLLLQRYPELRTEIQSDDRVTRLPRPPTTALEWDPKDGLIDLDPNETEFDDPEWDDIAMLLGAELVRSLRNAVWEKLNYTCSAGVARNKMMAKLGSSTHKPNKQTIVRNRAVQNFLGGFKFTKIRMLGGKLGDQVSAQFGTEQVSDLLAVPLEQFRAKLDDDTAAWLYNIIRGDDRSEVNPRTQIKSMLSAKSFRPSINSVDQADRWLRIFAADIYGRLVEDGVLENRRRPKTISLHHRQGPQVYSRQSPIPGSSPMDEDLLFELAKTLLRQVVVDGRAWPCANLSLGVGSFEDGVAKNQAIESFLLRGEQAKRVGHSKREAGAPDLREFQLTTEKRRKLDDNNGIRRFFGQPSGAATKPHADEHEETVIGPTGESPGTSSSMPRSPQVVPGLYTCDKCNKPIPEVEKDEHDDWHFAKDLENQERQAARDSSQAPHPSSNAGPANARGKNSRNTRDKPEKGQMRLRFG